MEGHGRRCHLHGDVMTKEIIVNNLDGLQAGAEAVLDFMSGHTILLMQGELGAGKTTLSKAVFSQLGVADAVTSPTFSIINTYISANGPVHHMDLYRLHTADEARGVGIEDYLHSGEICLVEWPEVALPLVPRPYVLLRIARGDHDSRHLSLTTIA